ncbi:hypothetical protein [Bacteroides timonensis]|uniref:hypothetical protein n=1 Tax=Bacteroides timonensis TaxID=1470345 RepID=UPI0004B942CB|nr:hypothetical protein [Bacteroides timonensis]
MRTTKSFKKNFFLTPGAIRYSKQITLLLVSILLIGLSSCSNDDEEEEEVIPEVPNAEIVDYNISYANGLMGVITFGINISVVVSDYKDYREWGIYLLQNGVYDKYYAPSGSNAYTDEMHFKFIENEFDYFSYEEHLAKKKIHVGTWIRRNILDVQNGAPEFEYSTPIDVWLIYDKPVSVKFDSCEVIQGPYPAVSYNEETGRNEEVPGSAWYDYDLHYTVTGAPFVVQGQYHIMQYEYGPEEQHYANGLVYSGYNDLIVSDGDNTQRIRQLSSTIQQNHYDENLEWIVLKTTNGDVRTDKSLHYFHWRDKGLSFTKNTNID